LLFVAATFRPGGGHAQGCFLWWKSTASSARDSGLCGFVLDGATWKFSKTKNNKPAHLASAQINNGWEGWRFILQILLEERREAAGEWETR
jgi:hypothetical protein